MNQSTRRSFMVGAGCAVAGSIVGARRGISAEFGTTRADIAPELRELIENERKNILATMAKEDIPGAAVCFIYEGKPVWIEGFGVTDRRSNRAVGTDTIFSIQSTSKNFTTTAIMLAVQRGLLDLDRPITAYVPNFTVNSRFESKPAKKITLRHLLSHRAGFTHEASVGNNYDTTFADFDSHVRSISQTWLRYPVNDRYRYSNLGFDLAGYILQTVSKMPFAECLRTMIFEPLGMSDATAEAGIYANRTNRAIGHVEGFESVPRKIPIIPSGGIYVSARDMAAYLLFHVNKGKNEQMVLLAEKQWNEMHRFQFPGAYSLGVAGGVLRFGESDIQMLLHSGSGFGFGCMFRFYPQAKLGWALLFNRAAGAGFQLGNGFLDDILSRRYGERVPKISIDALPSISLSPEELQKFVGNWRGHGFTRDLKLVDGTLVMQRDKDQVQLRVTSPVEVALPPDRPGGDAAVMRYFRPSKETTAHLEPLLTDTHLDYNDGPNDARGADKKEWEAYVGDYSIDLWGKPVYPVKIRRKNGYLYVDTARLIVEHTPGLFFTSDGEAVDFRNGDPTWGNIPLRPARQA